MSPAVTKHAIPFSDLARVEAKARAHGRGTDHYKIFMWLRYTGAHVITLHDARAKWREFEKGGKTFLEWRRPKKYDGTWRKLPEFPKNTKIDFNIPEFYEILMNRKRKTGNMYIYRIIRNLGLESGISDLSPNTLRHNHMMYLIDVLRLPIKNAADYMGCSVATATAHYDAWGKKTVEEKILASGDFG